MPPGPHCSGDRPTESKQSRADRCGFVALRDCTDHYDHAQHSKAWEDRPATTAPEAFVLTSKLISVRKERLCGSSISHRLPASYRPYHSSSVVPGQITQCGKGTPCERENHEAGEQDARDHSTDHAEEE